jgi:hypothetical protein
MRAMSARIAKRFNLAPMGLVRPSLAPVLAASRIAKIDALEQIRGSREFIPASLQRNRHRRALRSPVGRFAAIQTVP